ncbi:MAG TPA: GxxExxY protein [Lentisphaeria bacterium]|nr:MAG: GxxExxY protein [Lentisphaerae bacterium GWF2_50_93]HCE41934.1 GxxExxY protein [Lentisphaeria bacterium]
MNNGKEEFLFKETTEKIIKCFYKVFDELGSGFLESIYERALLIELKACGLNAESQVPLKVKYKGAVIGEFKADIVVDNKVIIEIKAVSSIANEHEAQLINYLRATGIRIGLLVNFGDKIEFLRRIY